jgi:phytanoyl-CoA hydroxylase
LQLSADQRENFERDGFLVLPGALSPDEVARLRDAAHRAESSWLASPTRIGSDEKYLRTVDPIIEYGDEFVDLLDHPRVFPLVRELVGDDVAIIDTSYFISPPRQGWGFSSEWHHDETLTREHPAPIPIFVKVFFPLTEVGPDDGPTAVLPGSHRRPLADDPPSVADPRELPGMRLMTAAPGDVYLFHGRIYHAGIPNTGSRTRRVLIYNYGHVWMKPWSGYAPSERLRSTATTALRKQLLHVVDDPYAAHLDPHLE